MSLDFLRQAPFALGDQALEWVKSTFSGLTLQGKVAQLLNIMLVNPAPQDIARLVELQPGAVTHLAFEDTDRLHWTIESLDQCCGIPLLHSADLEGGAFTPAGSTPMTNQLGMAATASISLYEQAVQVIAREAAALGLNWSFTPVLDINADFRSAIVATRSFGSEVETIEAFSRAHVRAMQRNGLAATAKHWPGEGFDPRDQHLVTTINPLDMEAWWSTFGKMYRQVIDDGVLSVMSAHIALPAYAALKGAQGLEIYRPASLSKYLNTDLLRGEFGFNGVIVSDATVMGGVTSWGPRHRVLPEVIESGCDMVLFGNDLKDDIATLVQSVTTGALSLERIDDAVMRILGLKAALGLHIKSAMAPETDGNWVEKLRTPQHASVAEKVAKASPTLVKDSNNLLPISPQKHRRVVIVSDPDRSNAGFFPLSPLVFADLLVERGFEVSAYDPDQPPPAGEVDLMIFLLAQESMLTKSHIYLDWVSLLGPMERSMQRSWHEIPTMLVSFGHPYYLYDAPRMPCVINAYSATEPVQRAVVRKLLGEEPFSGVSPVDAFCGLVDAHF
jgi:beta-N-acetylhexosaminidase